MIVTDHRKLVTRRFLRRHPGWAGCPGLQQPRVQYFYTTLRLATRHRDASTRPLVHHAALLPSLRCPAPDGSALGLTLDGEDAGLDVAPAVLPAHQHEHMHKAIRAAVSGARRTRETRVRSHLRGKPRIVLPSCAASQQRRGGTSRPCQSALAAARGARRSRGVPRELRRSGGGAWGARASQPMLMPSAPARNNIAQILATCHLFCPLVPRRICDLAV